MTFDLVCPNDSERLRFGEIVAHGFGFPAADTTMWFERAKHENLRVIREDGRVLGGLIGVPMGQFFGGRSVPMMGVSGVGISPDARGRGVGTQMMRAFEEDSKRAGFALSTLYGATHTLYERAGYFRAALQCKIKTDARMLQSMKLDCGDVKLEEVTELTPELHALYTNVSRNRPGFLDRGPYQWKRIIAPRGMTTKAWVAREQGVATGYVVLATKAADGSIDIRVHVLDMVATTRAAAHSILKILGSYASVADHVTWQGGPTDPFVQLLPERHHVTEVAWQSLTQIINPEAAIAARGFPKHARGEVALELSRSRLGVIEKSSHRLSIEHGAGILAPLTPANEPVLSLTERGLVALYTGLFSARQLVSLGDLEARVPHSTHSKAGAEAIEFLCDAFAGPTPAMCDHF